MSEDDVGDVGISPINESNDTRWESGKSANPNGRPKGTGKPKSRMRSTLTKLYAIQGDAIDVLEQVIKKGDKAQLTKEQIEAAKFVVKSIESLNNTCLREEMDIQKIREKNADAASDLEKNQEEPTKATDLPGFSMDMDSTKH